MRNDGCNPKLLAAQALPGPESPTLPAAREGEVVGKRYVIVFDYEQFQTRNNERTA